MHTCKVACEDRNLSLRLHSKEQHCFGRFLNACASYDNEAWQRMPSVHKYKFEARI